jgi:hypothetical protein
MWYCPERYKKKLVDLNAELLEIKDELNDKDAQRLLAQFLRHNLGLTVEILSGIKLAPYQEITLKAFFNRDFNLCVWGRGCAKSFMAAIFCFMYCIFEPGTKIIIAGPTFRTARNIFTELEKMVKSKGAELLYQCFMTDPPAHKNDLLSWEFSNGSSIKAIPMNGDKIRGFRASVIIIDEFLLITEPMYKEVLMPFLVAPRNIGERLKIKEIEDQAIKDGSMTEEQRTVFSTTAKLIALSSASYTFENLYTTFKEWCRKIENPDKEDIEKSATYFVSQVGFQAIPKEMIEKTVIEEASSGGLQSPAFLREYCAQFTDGSEGYFSAIKMKAIQIEPGHGPNLLLKGYKDKKYILAIDPSFSSSPSSDDFAMAVMEIDDETKHATLVHNYAVHGGNLKDHIAYFYYLVTHFNIVFLISDNADGNFIENANETTRFTDNNLNFKALDDWDANIEDPGKRQEMLTKVRRSYNQTEKRICIYHVFNSKSIRETNEHLQGCIDFKRVWFASRIRPDGSVFEKVAQGRVDLSLTPYKDIGEFIDRQDELLELTKKECALIEVRVNPQGTQTFDLPQHLRRSESPTRARKDNYTALVLGCWATRCYYEIMGYNDELPITTFSPIFVR